VVKALNLEKDSVGSVLFGSDSELAEGDLLDTKILFPYQLVYS
jgi:F0F1-type ATP synthase alpha subunit